MKPSLKEKLKKIVKTYKLRKEASTTGTAPVATGGVSVGGDVGTTPFAFSKRGARPDTVRQGGYSLAKPVKKSKNYALEGQMYSDPAYSTPATNIERVPTYKDKNGLVQHNDPEIDPNLVGFKQGQLPMTEGFNGLKYEQNVQQPQSVKPSAQKSVQQPPPPRQPSQKSTQPAKVDLQSYDVLPDFTKFDIQLKNSTESLKTSLQKTIQDKILGKKIVLRASKGYKQPEADYTVNVTGVSIDYYYDRYVIIIVGREENKQKMAKFFIKPGFKIKILGTADKLKPKDQYQVAKSKALVEPQQSATPTNTVTSDADDVVPPATPQKSQEKPKQ